MEILLAIVWYLALLMPGNYYTQENIYDIAIAHRPQVQSVMDNHYIEAVDFYNTFSPEQGGVLLPAYWDKEPVDHSDPTLHDPFRDNIRRKPADTTKNK